MKDLSVQAQNKINLVGKLLDVSFGEGKTSDNRDYRRASLTIRVTQTYGGHEETSEIPVSIFATHYTSAGKLNSGWKSIEDLHNFKSVQDVGMDNADKIRITGSSISENNFVSRNGQLINGWQIRGMFVSGATTEEVASFINDIFIMDMHEELDRNDEPTGRLVIKGGLVQYGGKLDVLEYIVEQPEAVEYISSHWNVNDTVTVRGRIRVTSQEEKHSASESSWGEELPETSTRMVRELIITRGSDEPFDEDFAYDAVEIKKAFNERKARLEQMQVDAKKGGSTKSATASAAPGGKFSWE
jgi:hypothetical protein